MKHVVIIGGVAVGPKVACRLQRLDSDIQITIVDRDSLISYGGCGIPYYVGGDVQEVEGLCSTASHEVRDAEFFHLAKGVTMRTRTEALSIDRKAKKLEVANVDNGEKEWIDYDALVIATGTSPFIPPIQGADLPGVFTVSNLHNARKVKEKIAKGQVEKAVVIGAGAIGIEMAEALVDQWDVQTTIVEMAPQILPVAIGPHMAKIVQNELERNQIQVLTSEAVQKIEGSPETGVTAVTIKDRTIDCDMVILASGVRPNTKFAADAGLATGRFGGLLVDARMCTSDPNIYAGGDCVEIPNLVSGQFIPMNLGSLANRQGRVIANNIYGKHSQFPGTVGNFCIKVFDMGMASAGLTFDQAKAAGFDPVEALVVQADRAHFYPTAELMFLHLIADKHSRKILGIEAAGPQGDAVKARVDAVAPLLARGVTVDDICCLEVSYAPPFASAMDIVNNAGNVLDNILDGRNIATHPQAFLEGFETDAFQVIDVRKPAEIEDIIEKYGAKWGNIPQFQFRDRMEEIPRDKPVCLVCGTGARSYECLTLLLKKGYENVIHVQGGHGTLVATKQDFI